MLHNKSAFVGTMLLDSNAEKEGSLYNYYTKLEMYVVFSNLYGQIAQLRKSPILETFRFICGFLHFERIMIIKSLQKSN